jgi:hypothetical protein
LEPWRWKKLVIGTFRVKGREGADREVDAFSNSRSDEAERGLSRRVGRRRRREGFLGRTTDPLSNGRSSSVMPVFSMAQ